MRRILGSSLLVALCAGPAAAQNVEVHWDNCNSPILANKQFAGPGVYRQVLRGFGFDAPMSGYSVRIRITRSNVFNTPYTPPADAWRFDPAGCNAGRASASASMQPCPALGSGSTVAVAYDGFAVRVTVSAMHDVVDPDPSVSYVLGEIAYDHNASAAGPQNPAVACGNADARACFVIEHAVWFDAQSVAHPIQYDPFLGLSWQDPGMSCFGDLPVQPALWSGVKLLYD